MLELTWARCDLERGLIDLSADEVTARRKGRAVVPMNDLARAVLSEAKTGARTPYVIEWAGQRVQKVRKGIATAATRANLADVTPHVFRHTAAVWMAENGVPMAEIAQYLGHSDSRVTERVYARFSPDYLRKAAGALEFGKVRAVT
ncbi:MAG: site-specific integrase [Bauldia sp.]